MDKIKIEIEKSFEQFYQNFEEKVNDFIDTKKYLKVTSPVDKINEERAGYQRILYTYFADTLKQVAEQYGDIEVSAEVLRNLSGYEISYTAKGRDLVRESIERINKRGSN